MSFSYDILNSEFLKYFPNYGDVEVVYEEFNHDTSIKPLDESKNDFKSGKYTCSVMLFGQAFTSNELYSDKTMALESSSKFALKVFDEFKKTLFSKTDDSSKILLSLVNYLKTFKSNTDKDIEEPNSAVENILLKISDSAHGKSQPAIQAHINSVEMSQNQISDPVSMLTILTKTTATPPNFEFFNNRGLYGCKLTFQKQDFITNAKFTKKQDAKKHAAYLAVKALFGENFITNFPVLDNQESNASKFVFGSTVEFPTSDPSIQEDRTLLKPFNRPPLPGGQKYVSVVNEICQRLHINPPDYIFSTSNTISSIYVCLVENFMGARYQSAPFNKKINAKEDVASRIYDFLEIHEYLPPQKEPKIDKRQYSNQWNSRTPPFHIIPPFLFPPHPFHVHNSGNTSMFSFPPVIPPPPFVIHGMFNNQSNNQSTHSSDFRFKSNKKNKK